MCVGLYYFRVCQKQETFLTGLDFLIQCYLGIDAFCIVDCNSVGVRSASFCIVIVELI